MSWFQNLPEWMQMTIDVFGIVSFAATNIALITPSKSDDRVATNLDRIGRDADRIGIAVKPILRSLIGLIRTK